MVIQLIQMVEMQKELQEQYPSIEFPEIDSLKKEVNVWIQDKRMLRCVTYEDICLSSIVIFY